MSESCRIITLLRYQRVQQRFACDDVVRHVCVHLDVCTAILVESVPFCHELLYRCPRSINFVRRFRHVHNRSSHNTLL